MTFKTMQELEREAYITGHTHMAELLADADDAEILLEDREAEMQAEIDGLKAQIVELTNDLKFYDGLIFEEAE